MSKSLRVWIDLANSPHVPLFVPVVEWLEAEGHDVVLSARDHAQTVGLARGHWPEIAVIGGESPSGRRAKGGSILNRSRALARFARRERPEVALSHASHSQALAARIARVPAVTMMDYEHQPANHLTFRLVRRVVVPSAFPETALRRFGASRKTMRYPGFKENLYLAGFEQDESVLDQLGLESERVLVVMRPPPEGALYHRGPNERFDELLELARGREDVRVVLLPRTADQMERFGTLTGVTIPEIPVDGRALLACADLVIGAGGTMNRESALIGTPTYTVFVGRLAAVDAELMRSGRLRDLRDRGSVPAFEKKPHAARVRIPEERRQAILEVVGRALADAGRS